MRGDPDLATVGAAIGEPARALMLSALLGGRELPAGELARVGGVAPSTASAHIARLIEAGLVAVEPRGRRARRALLLRPSRRGARRRGHRSPRRARRARAGQPRAARRQAADEDR